MHNSNTTHSHSQPIPNVHPLSSAKKVRSVMQPESSIASLLNANHAFPPSQDHQSKFVKPEFSPSFSMYGDSPIRNIVKSEKEKENFSSKFETYAIFHKTRSEREEETRITVESSEDVENLENSSPLDEAFMNGDSQIYCENSEVLCSSTLFNVSQVLPSIQVSSIFGNGNNEPADLKFSTFMNF